MRLDEFLEPCIDGCIITSIRGDYFTQRGFISLLTVLFTTDLQDLYIQLWNKEEIFAVRFESFPLIYKLMWPKSRECFIKILKNCPRQVDSIEEPIYLLLNEINFSYVKHKYGLI